MTHLDSMNSHHETDHTPMVLLRLKDVMARTGLGSSTIYRYMDEKKFPIPVKVGQASVRWYEHELNEWISGLPRNRAGE